MYGIGYFVFGDTFSGFIEEIIVKFEIYTF